MFFVLIFMRNSLGPSRMSHSLMSLVTNRSPVDSCYRMPH